MRAVKYPMSVRGEPFVALGLLMLLILLGVAPSRAQEVGATLFGTVSDPTGLVIPGAQVTATNEGTGRTFEVLSSETGEYILPSLTPATYTVRVEKAGFNTSILTMTLGVFQKSRVNIQLEIGSVTTTVEVSGQAPLVESGSASLGGIVEEKEITSLPLNLRRFGALARLMPGVVPDNGGFAGGSFGSPFSETTYSANGTRTASNNYLIDGHDSRSYTFGGFSLSPSLDAIQEFKVQTVIYSAAFGKMAGSTINLVMKSGTNKVHGSVFNFLRNDVLDARDFFSRNKTDASGNEIPGSARPPFRRNQFGAAAGAPIIKDKTWVFGSFESLRQTRGFTVSQTVPTAAMKLGDFSQLTDAAGALIPITDPLTCANPSLGLAGGCSQFAFGGTLNVIDPARINPVSSVVLGLSPWPNPTEVGSPRAGGANWRSPVPSTRRDDQFSIKVDHNLGEKDHLYVRYLFGQSTIADPFLAFSRLPGFADTTRYRGQDIALGWTHTFSPTMLNEFRFSFSRNNNSAFSPPRPDGFMQQFGIEDLVPLSSADEGFPPFQPSGYATIGDSNYRPVVSNDMVEKYMNNLTLIRGNHTFVLGVDLQPYQVLGAQAPVSPHSEYRFDGRFSGDPFADFVLGFPNGGQRSLAKGIAYQLGGFFSAYAQDDWHVNDRLSLNLGLRWEYARMPTDKRNASSLVNFFPIPGAPLFQSGNAKVLVPQAVADDFCQRPGFVGLVACASEMASLTGFKGRELQSLVKRDSFNWAPRIGIAMRPTGSDRLVIRTGYGLFFDLGNFNNLHFGFNNPVFAPNQEFTGATGQQPTFSLVDVWTAAGPPTLAGSFMSLYVQPDFQQPYVHESSFQIQSQLSENTALELGYVWTGGRKLGNLHLFANQAFPGVGDIQPRRPYPDFGNILDVGSDIVSNYHSFQLKFTKRLSGGLSFMTSYTLGKLINTNEGDEGFPGGRGNLAPQDDNNVHADKGRGYTDARNRFVVSGIWQLPFGSNRRWANQGGFFGKHLLGDWELAFISQFQSGYPISILTTSDFANTGSLTRRPDRSCEGSIPASERSVDRWFDESCFSVAAMSAALEAGSPRFGNSGRNIIDGVGLQNWDFTLSKNIAVTEQVSIQFRSEFYNAFNNTHFNDPNTSLGSASYNKITSTRTSRGWALPPNREIQFGLKVLF